MPTPVFTPRINNNDDTVRLAAVLVEVGAAVRAGDPMIDVETDKATFTVEAPVDGFLLKVLGSVEDTLDVGSTLAWLGDTPDEPIPGAPIHGKTSASGGDIDISGEPTLKALLLLKAYGLTSADVPATGSRLGVADVEKWVATKGLAKSGTTPAVPPAASAWSAPDVPGILIPFTPEQVQEQDQIRAKASQQAQQPGQAMAAVNAAKTLADTSTGQGTALSALMGGGGGGAKRISFNDGARYSTPVWSPKGDFIAFTRQKGGQFGIGVMKPDGSGERMLTEGFHNEGPTWAPNGLYVMFFRDPGGQAGPKMFMTDVYGRGEFPVATPGFASDPSWGPLLK
jgi:pyruvate/2-oxoglutarate dehydrogenase complex dihydrolipoamide acyltransferase (E2) component